MIRIYMYILAFNAVIYIMKKKITYKQLQKHILEFIANTAQEALVLPYNAFVSWIHITSHRTVKRFAEVFVVL